MSSKPERYVASTPAQRKADVHKYSRNAVAYAAGGAALLIIGAVGGYSILIVLGVLAVIVGGGMNAWKVRSIIHHQDEWS